MMMMMMMMTIIIIITWCFTPSQPLQLYQGEEKDDENGGVEEGVQ